MTTDIKMIRGTTFKQSIHLKQNGENYSLNPGEILRFGVKESGQQTRYIIMKEWTPADVVDGVFTLVIEPQDTLKMPYKKYKYDLGLQSGEDYFMIIPESVFQLCENITKWEEN